MREPTDRASDPHPGGASLYCLIDADNIFFPSTLAETEIRHLLIQLITACRERFGQFETVHLRLYGGWLEAGTLTRRASQIMQQLSGAFPLPMPLPDRSLIRGDWHLAKALHSRPSVEFSDTWRRRASAPRLQLAKSPYPDGCASGGSQCPAAVLKRITRSRTRTCPSSGCAVLSHEMFITSEQKQVDTMMTIDLMDIAQVDENRVVCVSDDTDFVPGLVAVSHMSPRIAYCNVQNNYDQQTRDLLTSLKILPINLAKAHP